MVALITATLLLSQSTPKYLAVETWAFSEVLKHPVAPNLKKPTIEFLVDAKRVQGNGGVNSFGGPAKYKGRTIKIGSLVSTLMAGTPEAMALEKDVLAALSKADHWRAHKDYLELMDGKSRVAKLYRFRNK